MLTNLSLEEVEKLIGKSGVTTGKDLRKALQEICFLVTPRMTKMFNKLYDHLYTEQYCAQKLLCMVRPIDPKHKRKGHWVVIHDKYVFDPALQNKMRMRSYFKRLKKQDRKITTYMVVAL